MASGRDSSQRADPGVQAARSCDNAYMKLSAKADYAVRAVLVLASHDDPHPLKGELIAASQDLPLKFVENILGELKHAGLVVSQRGPEGGYRLAVPADQITVAEVIRVVDGPLAAVAGVRPEAISYPPGAEALPDVWLQARSQLRSVLENVTFADLVQRSRERATKVEVTATGEGAGA
jgi:Rrf2 family protein